MNDRNKRKDYFENHMLFLKKTQNINKKIKSEEDKPSEEKQNKEEIMEISTIWNELMTENQVLSYGNQNKNLTKRLNLNNNHFNYYNNKEITYPKLSSRQEFLSSPNRNHQKESSRHQVDEVVLNESSNDNQKKVLMFQNKRKLNGLKEINKNFSNQLVKFGEISPIKKINDKKYESIRTENDEKSNMNINLEGGCDKDKDNDIIHMKFNTLIHELEKNLIRTIPLKKDKTNKSNGLYNKTFKAIKATEAPNFESRKPDEIISNLKIGLTMTEENPLTIKNILKSKGNNRLSIYQLYSSLNQGKINDKSGLVKEIDKVIGDKRKMNQTRKNYERLIRDDNLYGLKIAIPAAVKVHEVKMKGILESARYKQFLYDKRIGNMVFNSNRLSHQNEENHLEFIKRQIKN